MPIRAGILKAGIATRTSLFRQTLRRKEGFEMHGWFE